tara:strand:- start:2349 stop:3185 length:837 start_codon:yes stop_codon:yes gene_type:complete
MGEFINQINYAQQKWSKEYELILTNRCDKARCMAWLCTHTSNYYNKQRTYLLVPASAVSWSLNVFGMIATYMGKERISEPLVILIVSLGNFIVATLTTIAEKGKAGDKVELFNQTSRDYNLIASEINHQIMLPPTNRKPVMKILIETEKKYNDLMKSTPNIPGPITQNFIKINSKNKHFNEVSKPEGIVDLTPSRYNLYEEDRFIDPYNDSLNNNYSNTETLFKTPREPINNGIENIVINDIVSNIDDIGDNIDDIGDNIDDTGDDIDKNIDKNINKI